MEFFWNTVVGLRGASRELFVPSVTLLTNPDGFTAGGGRGGQLPAGFVAVGASAVCVGDASGLGVAVSRTRGVAEGVLGRGVMLLAVAPGLGVPGNGAGVATRIVGAGLAGVSKTWARANFVDASVGSAVMASLVSEHASAAIASIPSATDPRRLNPLTFNSTPHAQQCLACRQRCIELVHPGFGGLARIIPYYRR